MVSKSQVVASVTSGAISWCNTWFTVFMSWLNIESSASSISSLTDGWSLARQPMETVSRQLSAEESTLDSVPRISRRSKNWSMTPTILRSASSWTMSTMYYTDTYRICTGSVNKCRIGQRSGSFTSLATTTDLKTICSVVLITLWLRSVRKVCAQSDTTWRRSEHVDVGAALWQLSRVRTCMEWWLSACRCSFGMPNNFSSVICKIITMACFGYWAPPKF